MRRGTIGLLVVACVVAIAAYASGAGKSSTDVTFCAVKKTGAVSLASGKGNCGKGEKKVVIAKKGPAGPQGAPGAPGPAGADAANSLESIHFVTGPATDQCFEKPGTFCKATLGNGWTNYANGFGGVGFYKEPNGIVHLVGVAELTGSGGESGGFQPEGPFYLPPGYRPSADTAFAAAGGNANLEDQVTVVVRTNGVVAILDEFGTLASLDGISFRP